MAFRFEWDPEKAATNLAKHGVSFERGRVEPDKAARAYLMVIARLPDAVAEALKPAA